MIEDPIESVIEGYESVERDVQDLTVARVRASGIEAKQALAKRWQPIHRFIYGVRAIGYYWNRLRYPKGSKVQREKDAQWLRRYMKWQFKSKGMIGRDQIPLPYPEKRPYLILTLDYHAGTPFYLYQQLPFPVIVPVPYRDKAPSFRFPEAIKTVSYPETVLEKDLPNIQACLSAGHSVVVHLNPTKAVTTRGKVLYIQEGIRACLEMKGVETVFVHQENMDQTDLATRQVPVMVTTIWDYKKALLKGLDGLKEEETFKTIASFFGYSRYEWVQFQTPAKDPSR